MNQPLYTDLLNASCVLMAIKDTQDQIIKIKNEITQRNLAYKELTAKSDKPLGYKARIGWGIALIRHTALVSIADGVNSSDLPFFFFAVIIPGVIGIWLLLWAITSAQKCKEAKTIEVASTYATNQSQNKLAMEESSNLEEKLAQLQAEGKDSLEILPETYRNSEAACYMLLSVKDGRADSLKEAMNLYEEQLHNWAMEKLLQDNQRMQQIHAASMQAAMNEIVNNQERLNKKMTANTVLHIVNTVRK